MTFTKSVLASELPQAWRKEARLAPDDRVVVRVEAEDSELAAARTLEALMDLIGRRAQERGLTEEKLEAILNDE